MNNKVFIVGGGPIGCFLAEQLKECTIIEEHKKIGFPVQCTGLVSSNLFNLVSVPDNIILNKVEGAEIFFPNGKSIYFKGKAYVLDRASFDNYLYERASSYNNHFILGERVKFLSDHNLFTSQREIKISKEDIVVGADGPLSIVGKNIGITNKVLPAYQVTLKGKFDPASVQLYLGRNIAPNFFGWVVPEDEKIARVGLAAPNNHHLYLKKLLSKLDYSKKVSSLGGLIPIDFHKYVSKNNFFLVGDAASQTKASTGGGIITGLIAAKELAKAIENPNYDYNKNWYKVIGKDLKLAYFLKQVFNRLSDKELNELYNLASSEKFKSLLEAVADMEYYSKFMNKLICFPTISYAFKTFIKHPSITKDIFNFLI